MFDEDINLDAPELREMLSDFPVDVPTAPKPAATQTATSNVADVPNYDF